MSYTELITFDHTKNGDDVKEYFKTTGVVLGQMIKYYYEEVNTFENGLKVTNLMTDTGKVVHYDDGNIIVTDRSGDDFDVPYSNVISIYDEIDITHIINFLNENLKDYINGSFHNVFTSIYLSSKIFKNILSELNLLANM